jgi:hypothetical protein
MMTASGGCYRSLGILIERCTAINAALCSPIQRKAHAQEAARSDVIGAGETSRKDCGVHIQAKRQVPSIHDLEIFLSSAGYAGGIMGAEFCFAVTPEHGRSETT